MDRLVGALATHLDEDVAEQERINCHHNFTQRERHFGRDVWVSRKGAIEYRDTDAFIDEIPAAYKDIDQVMADAADLVEIRHTLRQVVNVKGD